MRAKVSNFSLARAVEISGRGQLTRHVVGTQGYMAPEYLEHGLITPKIDVFAFGVVLLELLSGREAFKPAAGGSGDGDHEGDVLLSSSVREVVEGEGVREKLRGFMDPLSLAFCLPHLAKECIAQDPSDRPGMMEVHMSLLMILSSSLDRDPFRGTNSDSFVHGL